MDVYNERTGFELVARPTDTGDNPTVPSTLHWRLDCETTGKELQGWTEVTPTSVLSESGLVDVYATIEVPASLNVIQDSRNWKERKTLLVSAAKDQSGEYNEVYQYDIKNLRGRS